MSRILLKLNSYLFGWVLRAVFKLSKSLARAIISSSSLGNNNYNGKRFEKLDYNL